MQSITLCLTIGRRPDLLKRTLDSLLARIDIKHVIAINDFRDDATNEMFKALCPYGQLISLDTQLGHHEAVDHMYGRVTTPYVLHCEDDWLFEDALNIIDTLSLLNSDPHISQVCLRKVADFNLSDDEQKLIVRQTINGHQFSRLDAIHAQWHGYTFNPHLVSLDLWRKSGGFNKFKKERHISRHLRAQGYFTAYIDPGCCSHIGEEQSVSPSAANPTGLRLIRKKIKSFFL